MRIVIDTDKRVIEVPSKFKKYYENQVELAKMVGNKCGSILDMVNVEGYTITTKIVRSSKNADKTSLKDIETYMNSIKNSDKEKYQAYESLKKDTNNFFTIRKWFYSNFPNQKPNKKS